VRIIAFDFACIELKLRSAKLNSVTSPLLRLPGEIRTKIWQYAIGYHQIDIGHRRLEQLCADEPARNVRPSNPATHFPRTFVRPSFALPRTCRQMYVETSPYIYTLNTFGFESVAVFDRWTKNRALGQRRLVASIDMPYDYMHLYRGGFGRTFRQKFENIKPSALTNTLQSSVGNPRMRR
jgi:hypothetical protein